LILLDTHVVIWLALEPSRISKNASLAMDETRQAGESLAISDMTLLEVTLLYGKKRVHLNSGLESFLVEVARRFTILPITARACVRSISLPLSYPKDPADRVIGATALVEGLSLITADRAIRKSRALTTIW
jgi:PIN domain nuclease of toxin-antitoxin system